MRQHTTLALSLLVAAILTTTTPSTTAVAVPAPVCMRDETEAIVALMASLLVDPNCLRVADDKCPSDSRCLERLARIAHKMPDCLSSASNMHKSQHTRLQQLVDNCKAPVANATNATNTSKSAAGNESYLNEMAMRSTASSAASLSIAMCCLGVMLSIIFVAFV